LLYSVRLIFEPQLRDLKLVFIL